jgi:hypothetical protein
MDLAYDHIQETALSLDESAENGVKKQTLNNDFQDAYKAISSSQWGSRLGGFWGNVVKQVSLMQLCEEQLVYLHLLGWERLS